MVGCGLAAGSGAAVLVAGLDVFSEADFAGDLADTFFAVACLLGGCFVAFSGEATSVWTVLRPPLAFAVSATDFLLERAGFFRATRVLSALTTLDGFLTINP